MEETDELMTFLSKYGEIYEIKLARNYHDILNLHKREAKIT